jgi:hypothetical protein
VPYGTRAPKELLHHLPALILRRPSVSADPTEMLSGLLGSRLLDRRPPHYRCPAVPGFKASARAILMALGSSVLPSGINHLLSGDCVLLVLLYCVLLVMRTTQWPATAPLFGSQPVLRLLWLGTPLPNFPVRASAADAFTEVLLTDFTAGYCELHLPVLPLHQLRSCSRWPLITAGHPVRSSVPSPSCKNPGSETPPPHRPAYYNYIPLPGSSCLPGPAVALGYDRNNNQTTTQCLLWPTQVSACPTVR